MTPRVIFLGGLGRSGSTLLERLIGELPGVAPLGEVVHLWERGVLAGEPCGCGRAFPSCPFWQEVGERAFGGWTPVLAGRVMALRRRVDRTRRLGRGHADLPEYVHAYRLLYEAAAGVSGAEVVVDSSKHASLAYCLFQGGLDPHIVQVVREPRAVAHSWGKTVERPEDGRPMTRWGPVRTAVHWSAQNLALELLARRGARVTRVRYEDLVAAPCDTLARLVGELGLPASRLPFLHGTTAHLTTAHTVSGNPMRFSAGPVELSHDDAWRRGLPRRQQSLVAALTWPLRARYGYGSVT